MLIVCTILTTVIILLLAYPYCIYPLLLWWATRHKDESINYTSDFFCPEVSLILSVYNEEKVIEEKIDNFQSLNYPSDKMELLIVSDGSTDLTDSLIRGRMGPSIRLIRQEREGKTAALNRAVEQSKAEVLVFTDANTFFAPDALQYLVAPFINPVIGLVSGRVMPTGTTVSGEGMFGRFETFLKMRESALGVIAGADGAIYALKRTLYTPLAPRIINDFIHPMQVAGAGFRSVFAHNALAYEESEDNPSLEFFRQKRMANQAFAILREMLPRLITDSQFMLVWVLLSHKLLRWIHAPVFGMFAFCSIWLVLIAGSKLFLMLSLLYSLIFVAGKSLAALRKRVPFIHLLYSFQLVHVAYITGIIESLQGRSSVIWNPRGGA